MYARQQRPFCARCRIVGDDTSPLGVWAFIRVHGVVGFVPADDPVIPSPTVDLPFQRAADDYSDVSLEADLADR